MPGYDRNSTKKKNNVVKCRELHLRRSEVKASPARSSIENWSVILYSRGDLGQEGLAGMQKHSPKIESLILKHYLLGKLLIALRKISTSICLLIAYILVGVNRKQRSHFRGEQPGGEA